MPSRKIYVLSPKQLSPETIAVAFAKTSRSPSSFQQIADELSDEKSAKFHEKWVVGYGHASVAEHAVLHIAIENVSRLAVETIESNRLASYTEKSTRYQKWDAQAFYIPDELEESSLRTLYIRTCKLLFQTYLDTLQPLRDQIEARTSRRENESDETFERRIRSQYIDSCRFLLPAASLANVGMTANARVLEHAISKMMSSALGEVRKIGEEVKKAAQVEVPTLVKYANSSPYLKETGFALSKINRQISKHINVNDDRSDWCTLVEYDPDGENKILSAALFHYGDLTWKQAFSYINSATREQRKEIANLLFNHLTNHDIPIRELEFTTYTFEVTLDQGGYAELKRHRMMTQSPQQLNGHLGYAIPRLIKDAGLVDRFTEAMEAAAHAYEKLTSWNPTIAAYLIPNGFNRRVLIRLNLREAFSFCQLRAAPNAHYSMRRVSERIAFEIQRVHPILASYLLLPNETWQEVENTYFLHP